MEVIFLLVPVSLMLIGLACLAFVWSAGSGQFDNLDIEAERILLDDDVISVRADVDGGVG